LQTAQSFGVYGADVLAKAGQKGLFAPFKPLGGAAKLAQAGVGAGAGFVGRKITEKSLPLAKKGFWGKAAFAIINPKTTAKAWQERTHKREHTIEHLAQGGAGDIISGVFKEPSSDTQSEAFEHAAMEAAKELPYGGERVTFDRVYAAIHTDKKDKNAQKFIWGQVIELAKNRGMNYLLTNAQKLGLLGEDSHNYTANREGFIQFMNDMHKAGYADESETAHLQTALSGISYDNREYWYSETTGTSHGHPQMIKTDKDGNIIGRKEFEDNNEKVKLALAEKAREVMLEKNFKSIQQARTHMQKLGIDQQVKTDVVGADKLNAFNNYETYVNGREEAVINSNKLEAQGHARDVHWSNFVQLEEKGTFISPEGFEFIKHASSANYSQANRLQPKKIESMNEAFATEGGWEKVAAKLSTDIQNEMLLKAKVQAKEEGRTLSDIDVKNIKETAKLKADYKTQAFYEFYVPGKSYTAGNERNLTSFKEIENAIANAKTILDREKANDPTSTKTQEAQLHFDSLNKLLKDLAVPDKKEDKQQPQQPAATPPATP
jgi:hypothetical protein